MRGVEGWVTGVETKAPRGPADLLWHRATHEDAASARSGRTPMVSPHPAHLVPEARPLIAVARDQRPVPYSRLRNHAAADAGRSRPAEISRVARALPLSARAR